MFKTRSAEIRKKTTLNLQNRQRNINKPMTLMQQNRHVRQLEQQWQLFAKSGLKTSFAVTQHKLVFITLHIPGCTITKHRIIHTDTVHTFAWWGRASEMMANAALQPAVAATLFHRTLTQLLRNEAFAFPMLQLRVAIAVGDKCTRLLLY